jgi:uncharacterized protein
MTYLLDVNVLVALAWPVHVHHGAAHVWFRDNHERGWSTCAVTESGFIRVSSNRRATSDARPPAEAAAILRKMCSLSGHSFVSDSVQLSRHAGALQGNVHGSSQVTDVHLILLAKESELCFVTFDKGAAQLANTLDAKVEFLSI